MTLSGWHVGYSKNELASELVRRFGWDERPPYMLHAPLMCEKMADILAALDGAPMSPIWNCKARGRQDVVTEGIRKVLDELDALIAQRLAEKGRGEVGSRIEDLVDILATEEVVGLRGAIEAEEFDMMREDYLDMAVSAVLLVACIAPEPSAAPPAGTVVDGGEVVSENENEAT